MNIFKELLLKLNADNKHICKNCKEEVNWSNTATKAGYEEYNISGLCEKCFDNLCYNLEDSLCMLDEDILSIIKDGVILAGGALRTLLDGSDIQDYDLFFLDQAKIKVVKKYLISKNYKNIFTCPKGELFTYYNEYLENKVQLINKRSYKDCEDIINSFDITACCCAYDGTSFYKHERFVFDSLNMRINLNTIEYPVATMKRIAKYISKGYALTNEASTVFVTVVNSMQITDDNTAFYID